MRFFLLSFIFHIIFILSTNIFPKDEPLEFKKVGEVNVSFSMVDGSPQPAPAQKVEDKERKIQKKIEKKIEKKIQKKKIEKKEIVKTPKEDVVVVPKKKTPEPPKEELLEKTTEKVIDETDKNTSNIEEEAIEETIDQAASENRKNPLSSDSFLHLADGSVVAKNQGVEGLSYGWISNPDPEYPKIARKMKYDKDVVIKVRFLLGYDGLVEDIKFYDNMTDYGFRGEVEKTLKHWRATPIMIDNKRVKLYFYKTFKFKKIA